MGMLLAVDVLWTMRAPRVRALSVVSCGEHHAWMHGSRERGSPTARVCERVHVRSDRGRSHADQAQMGGSLAVLC